jgi:alpha-glucosidase
MRNSKGTRALWFLVSCMAWAATSWTEPDWSGSVRVAREADPGSTVIIESPDGNLRVVFGLYETTGRTAAPCYDVSWRGRVLVQQASLGIDLEGSGSLGGNFRIVTVRKGQRDDTYAVFPGKTSTAHDNYREATITLEERAEPRRRLDLMFRAYNDGAAFRYQLPKQSAITEFTITEERSTFAFVGNPKAYALPLGSFTTSYEQYYRLSPIEDVTPSDLLGLPLLLAYADDVWLAVTEANLTDYAGMYLSGVAGRPGALVTRLSPSPDNPLAKVRARAPHVSPWRVPMIADEPGTLIESNLILNLSNPRAIADISWIRPGKTTFPWWNGYELGDAGFRGGLNTETMKHYIDFCAEQGIEYHTLDGFDRAWYGGPFVLYEGADITESVAEIDLPEVLGYARRKGVRLRLWLP